MTAGAVCRIGDGLYICRISPKEDHGDFDEVILIEGRIYKAQVRPGSSAGGLLTD
jgi:hypothetical protein